MPNWLPKKRGWNWACCCFPIRARPTRLQAPDEAPPLASREDVEQAAAKNNPELKSALAALGVSNADVLAARAAYLPDLGLNVTYGVDAPQFAVNGPDESAQPGLLGQRHARHSGVGLALDRAQGEAERDSPRRREGGAQRHAEAVDCAARRGVFRGRRRRTTSLPRSMPSVATAAESLRLTKLRYSGGEATVLEVVDAQNAYVSAENAREDGRVRYEAARADLQTLTGTM